jgi:GH15 family glucan-1,4-alpha-glucosidase
MGHGRPGESQIIDMKRCQNAYPPISDYALISNCQCAALISRAGSIDWCCMPRIDSDSCFGRLLDWRKGGYCSVFPTGGNVDAPPLSSGDHGA